VEFLRRHWEKLVLGICLLVVLTWSVLLLQNLHKVQTELTQLQSRNAGVINNADKAEFDKLGPDNFTAAELLNDQRLRWRPAADKARGTLLDPVRLVVCSHADCDALLFHESKHCAICDRAQVFTSEPDVLPTRTDENLDSDGDGIPDIVENRYDFLCPDNPQDAAQDHDGDGFTNLENYLHNTAMDDPRSHPPLALRLRMMRTERREVPLRLNNLSTNGSEDKQNWSIWVNVYEQRGWRSRNVKLGTQLGPYTLTDVEHVVTEELNPQLNVKMPVDRSFVVLQRQDGSTLKLVRNATAYEEGATVLRFLHPINQPEKWQQMTVRVGQIVDLNNTVGETEQYRVEEIRANSVIVRRLGDHADTGRFEVKRFDPAADVPTQRRPDAGDVGHRQGMERP